MENHFRLNLAIATSIALLTGNVLASSPWLNGKDLAYVFAGREVNGVYANGATFVETYHRDGSITYIDTQQSLKGNWKIDGEQFCTTYDGGPGGCYTVKKLSENCFEYWLADSNSVETGWLARASQSKYPDTCKNES